jgi:hypothetical protein
VDFGIAKAVAGDGATVTALGFVVGTPDYMAPEQAAGRAVDARADVYALGLVAFNALTGTLAFAGETPHARMLRRLSEAPLTLAAARPDVAWPSALQAVLDRALARDPAARYQSAGALGRDLATAVADWRREPRGASWQRAWRRSWRWPWPRSGAALRRTAVVLRARVIGGAGRGRARLAGAAVVLALVGVALQREPPAPPVRTLSKLPPAPAPSGDTTATPAPPGDPSPEEGTTGEEEDGDSPAPYDPPPGPRPRPTPPAPSRDLGAELRRVEEATAALPALTGATRERAALATLADIARLLPELRGAHDSVAALYHAAEVHLLLGDASTACDILLRLREPARRTEYADNVAAILSAPMPVCRAY